MQRVARAGNPLPQLVVIANRKRAPIADLEIEIAVKLAEKPEHSPAPSERSWRISPWGDCRPAFRAPRSRFQVGRRSNPPPRHSAAARRTSAEPAGAAAWEKRRATAHWQQAPYRPSSLAAE